MWLDQVRGERHGISKEEVIDDATAEKEALMMGLRLTAGIDHQNWRKKFGRTLCGERTAFLLLQKSNVCKRKIIYRTTLLALKATREGFMRLNAVLGYLLN